MEIEKKYYTIGQVGKITDLSSSLLRFWETEFEGLNPKKNRSGNRRYLVSDIELIKEIKYLLKDRGFTIQGAKEQLKNPKVASEQKKVIEKLESMKSFLKEIRENIAKNTSIS